MAHWQALEEQAGTSSWRLQTGLFRAYYDAYIRERLIVETALEEEALAQLERASQAGVAPAIEAARAVLAKADAEPVAPELRRRIEELAQALFDSIGMQLSVEKFGANNWERGAVLDAVDRPLNDRVWLETRFDAILSETEEEARLALVSEVLDWEDPGPGGFYDDLGNATREPHLVRQKEWEDDPGFVASPQDEFIEVKGREAWRLSWLDQGQTLFGTPLQMRYNGLEPAARYRLRVVYAGRFRSTHRLTADGEHEIHGPMPQPGEPERQEFDIPEEATKDGVLELQWDNVTGRGCQVAEVWLLRRN